MSTSMAAAAKPTSCPPLAQEYTIALIYVKPLELTAITTMLDERFDPLALRMSDSNEYILGRIGDHKVIITGPPVGEQGKVAAATVVSHIRSSFPSILFGILVGIGGGVPHPDHDVRLGDVVVGAPEVGPAVVQYDLGKQLDTYSITTRTHNKPPDVLRNAVNIVRDNMLQRREGEQRSFTRHLRRFQRSLGCAELYARPIEEAAACADDNFDAYKYGLHDEQPEVRRGSRKRKRQDDIDIHYSTILCGDQVMKSAKRRDELSSQYYNALCFEMEASGIVDQLPCLVVRGICDYADANKQKSWQNYAAATAACYAREILLNMAPRISDNLPLLQHDKPRSNHSLMSLETRREWLQNSLKFEKIDSRRFTIKTAYAKTCSWLFRSLQYQEWLNPSNLCEHGGVLWVKGKPGVGKSTLTKFAFEKVLKQYPESVVVSFFFNARGSDLEKSTIGLYRSLILQIIEKNIGAFEDLFDFLPQTTTDMDSHAWSLEALRSLFVEIVRRLRGNHIICFVDALDECPEDSIREMISTFEELNYQSVSHGYRLHIFFASRHYPNLNTEKSINLVLENDRGHEEDIWKYVNSVLKAGRSRTANAIRDSIISRSSGIFLWVVLVIGILNREFERGARLLEVSKLLDEIPKGLDALFEDILTRDSQDLEEHIICLSWILFSARPLRLEEHFFALLSSLNPGAPGAWDQEEDTLETMKNRLLRSSKGLAEITKTKSKDVQFIHESVREYLLKGDTFSKLRARREGNTEAEGHELLKTGCEAYLWPDLRSSLGVGKSLPTANSVEGKALRKLAIEKHPFLQYASEHLFYHADRAEEQGIPQHTFLSSLSRANLVWASNILQHYDVRRFSDDVGLLYILSQQNRPYLISMAGRRCLFDPNTGGERYGSALHAAATSANTESVRALIDSFQEIDINYQNKAGCTALMLAAAKGAHEIVKVLLDCPSVRINLVDRKGWNALCHAAYDGPENLQSIILLLEADVEVGALHSTSESPLKKVADRGYVEVIKVLFKAGVKPTFQERYEGSELQYAAEHGRHDLIELFLNPVTTKTSRDMYMGLVCITSVKSGHHEVAKMMIQAGADINAQDGFHENALQVAARMGHKEMVRLLLEAGADVNAQDGLHENALHSAARTGYKGIVRLLLEAGADVNAQGGYYGNALQAAAHGGHTALMKLLLEAGADVNAQGGIYGNALQAAKELHTDDIFRMLIAAGAREDPDKV